MKKIIFNELLGNYNKNLITKLRGFGDDSDYLQYWVPATSKINSLINLIEALFESKTYLFTIELEKKDEELASEIFKFDKKIGTIEKNIHGNKISLIFKINSNNPKLYLKSENKISNVEEKKFYPETNQINRIREKETLKNYIKNNIDEMNISKLRFKISKEIINCKTYSEKLSSKNIHLQINNSLYIVENAYHDFDVLNYESKTIDIFLSQIIGKHIQEISEHSVIYLENFLRPRNILEKHGIILPFKSGNLFEDINVSIRSIYKKFKNDFNYVEKINKDYPAFGKKWSEIKDDERENLVSDVILNFVIPNLKLKKNDIILNRIELEFKLVVELSEEFRKRLKKENLLFKIESILKEKVEKRVELFTMEVRDQNKLRLKNSPQNLV